ncbi:MAG: tetratricopeptide repeat protein [Pirellulales bacterium]|nr:tetratricopeptide repeat protein [Pirellulales bacterium]
MSKKNKTRRNNRQKRRVHTNSHAKGEAAIAPRRTRQRRWRELLSEAESYMMRKRWADAREVLEECDHIHPGRPDVLQMLAEVHFQQGDHEAFYEICRRLSKEWPNDPAIQLMLAGACMQAMRPASAIQAFREYLRRWPNDPMAAEVRISVAQLEADFAEMTEEMPFSAEDRIELAAMHEEATGYLGLGEYEKLISTGQRLLSRAPDFIPVMNNMSLAHFMCGRPGEAIAMAQRVIQRDPDNPHALGNLARFLLFDGQKDEAQQMCERLRRLRAEEPDTWAKKAETLSFFGDDQGVLDTFAEAKRAGFMKKKIPEAAVLHHLAAVANARLGHPRKAQQLWRDALKIWPGLSLTVENLEDAKRPPAERHGPWYYDLGHWLGENAAMRLAKDVEKIAKIADEKSAAEAARRYVREHPGIVNLVAALLDRGGEVGREFAWNFARCLDTPELTEVIREFCLSQRGTDALRMEAASYLSEKGALSSEPQRMWIRGEWNEIEVLGFEITCEPTGPGYSEEVEEWAIEASEAIRQNEGPRAERLLRKCIEVDGEKPSLLHNLAMSWRLQRRDDEAIQLIREIHQRWPDYFFGRIGVAYLATMEGDYERAGEYLASLRQRKRFHQTEYEALCLAYIRLFIQQDNLEAAKRWGDMLADVNPDHPELERIEPLLSVGGAIQMLMGRMGMRRRKNKNKTRK